MRGRCLQKRTRARRSFVPGLVERKTSSRVSPSVWLRSRWGYHATDDAHACVQCIASPLFGRGYYVRRRRRGCACRGDETRSSESPVTLLEYVRCLAARGTETMPGDNVSGSTTTRWWSSISDAKHERNFPRSNRRRLTFGARETSTCKMSWLGWSADIKKRACKYLLQRYLGHFLHDLSLDQLTVDLYNGKGQVDNVYLNVQVG